jgi:hypothetical protein
MISASKPAEAPAAASGLTPPSGSHQARPLLSASTSLPPSGLPAAPAAMVRAEGAGKLLVMSTLLEGGAKAVRCEGSGELQAVRWRLVGLTCTLLSLQRGQRTAQGVRVHVVVRCCGSGHTSL